MKKINDKSSPWLDCYNIKLKSINNDPTRLQVSSAGVVQTSPEPEILVEDHTSWIFKNPADSSQAYLTGISDDGTQTDKKYLEQYQNETLKELTKDTKKKLTQLNKDVYRAKYHEQQIVQKQLEASLNSGKKYEWPLHVVDTDYDNYLITW